MIPKVLSTGPIPPFLQEAVVAEARIPIRPADDVNGTNATRNATLTDFVLTVLLRDFIEKKKWQMMTETAIRENIENYSSHAK